MPNLTKMQTAKINNWFFSYSPRENTFGLIGTVYGHPQIGDGKFVRTSAITVVKHGLIVTKNTEYTPLLFDNGMMPTYENNGIAGTVRDMLNIIYGNGFNIEPILEELKINE